MFKPHNMFSSNLTHSSNKWPNYSFRKEDPEEDSVEDSEVEEEDSAMGEDEVMNQSSDILVGYLGITKYSSLMCSAHTVQPTITMLKDSLS